MRNFIKFSTLMSALMAFTTACNKEVVGTVGPSNVTPTSIAISEVGRQQIESSLVNWNASLKALAIMKDYKVADILDSEGKRTRLIEELTYSSAMVAYGNASEPQKVKLHSVGAMVANNPESAELLKKALEQQIRIGDKVVEINWTRADGNFVTKCLVNESGIVWDNLLYNVQVLLPAVESSENMLSAVKTHHWAQQSNWIWGAKRGEMGYMMRINYAGTIVLTTEIRTWANLNNGTAFHKGLVTQSEGAQGIAKVALGLATPVMSLNFNENDFILKSNSGHLLNIQEELLP